MKKVLAILIGFLIVIGFVCADEYAVNSVISRDNSEVFWRVWVTNSVWGYTNTTATPLEIDIITYTCDASTNTAFSAEYTYRIEEVTWEDQVLTNSELEMVITNEASAYTAKTASWSRVVATATNSADNYDEVEFTDGLYLLRDESCLFTWTDAPDPLYMTIKMTTSERN
jgi:hypothetical protein